MKDEKEELISVKEFCLKNSIDESFIFVLLKSELIEITRREENLFIHPDQLLKLEKLARFHYDLSINVEGIEVIEHLLNRIENLQQEINSLRNRLQSYE